MTPATLRAEDVLPVVYGDAEGMVNLRAIALDPTVAPAQAFVAPTDTAAIARFCHAHADRELFFGVALRRDDSSGALANCTTLAALFVDLDFKTFPGGEAEARAALARCPLLPTTIVHSGGGLHAYWTLVEPFTLAAHAREAKDLLRRLAACVEGDLTAAEPARVLRLPGTANHKYQPARPVMIESLDATRVYQPSDFDDWLPSVPRETPVAAPVNGVIAEGARNVTLTSLAGTMQRRNMTPEAITVALMAENAARCRPPLAESEVTAIARSVGRYDPEAVACVATPPVARERWPAFSEVELLHRPRVEWLIPDRIPRNATVGLWGPPGVGKTSVATDASLSLVYDVPWLGVPVTNGGPVLYVAAEAAQLQQARVRSWKLMRGFDLDQHRGFVTVEDAVQLCDDDEVSRFIEAFREAAPVATVFDTLARCMVGVDENSTQFMGHAMANADRIRAALHTTVILIHHSNANGNKARGNTAFLASVDTSLQLDPADDLITLRCEKQRGAAPFDPIRLRLAQTPDGDTVLPALAEATAPEAVTATQLHLLTVLREQFTAAGATATQWEKSCASIPRASFYRALKVLLDRGGIGERRGKYVPVGGDAHARD